MWFYIFFGHSFPSQGFICSVSVNKILRERINISINGFYYIFYSCHANKKSGVFFSPVVIVISLHFSSLWARMKIKKLKDTISNGCHIYTYITLFILAAWDLCFFFWYEHHPPTSRNCHEVKPNYLSRDNYFLPQLEIQMQLAGFCRVQL